MLRNRGILGGLTIAGLTACVACFAQAPQGPAQRSPQPAAQSNTLTVETVATGLVNPWGLALLTDGRMLVTERPGRLRWVGKDGKLSEPLGGVPAVAAAGQGGLLDITLDPQFERNQTIYLSYAEPEGSQAGTAVLRARVGATSLTDVVVIYRQVPKVSGAGHFGSRIVFAPDGKMFVTQGDRFSYRERAQDLTWLLGKVVRINPDGTIPKDNPFVGRGGGVREETWSYGHRNMQGAAIDPATGQLWTIEHGAAGGDELNHPEAGKNYGWPVITYGRDYNGMKIGEGAVKEGMEQPVYYWDPVIAPGGLAFYNGSKFPGWKGSILAGSMVPGGLVRLTMQDGRVVSEERHLGELHERIRDVQVGPDELIYVLTDNSNGRILRLSPK